MKECRLSREAVVEIAEAAAWIGSYPDSFPLLLDLPEELSIRRALLPRFPYALVFMELPPEVRVLAVAHLKRRPGYWLNRIRS